MPKPLIFISHSVKDDPGAKAMLKVIRARLARDFDVLLDKDRLQGGDDWRRCLHTWLAHCHGGIILLNKHALESPWVRKEATILTWRAAMQPRSAAQRGFPILPVLSGVTAAEVAASAELGPLSLPEFQSLAGRTPTAIAKEIARLLEPLKSAVADTPQRVVEEKLAAKLRGAGDAALTRLVAVLREDLGGWQPNIDRAGQAAMLLLQASPEVLPDALQQVAGGSLLPSVLGEIIDVLECFWVDPEAAAVLTATARAPVGTRAALLNATDVEFTPKAYIARAGLKVPSWRSVRVSTAAGEDLIGAIGQQVSAELQRLSGKTTQSAQRDYLIKRDAREPLLVVVPPPAEAEPLLSDIELKQLLARFDYCTLVVLTGPSQPSADVLPAARRLTPPLAPSSEDEACDYYRLCRDLTHAI